jgi:hypothetical protein
MAPLEVDIGAMQAADVQTSYAMMFEHMKEDFLTRRDFEIMMATANVYGAGKVAYVPNNYVAGEVLHGKYQALVKQGQIVKKGILSSARATVETV